MELGKSLQNSLIKLFIGCHKRNHVSRTTLTLRSYLYQNLSQIMMMIAELIDATFMMKVLKPIYEDKEDGGRQNAENSKFKRKPDNKGS